MAETYKFLNPLGIQEPVKQYPLAAPLDTLKGKTIYLCINAGGDQDITIPLLKKLPAEYPETTWKVKRQFGFSAVLTDEERAECDGVIAGVIW